MKDQYKLKYKRNYPGRTTLGNVVPGEEISCSRKRIEKAIGRKPETEEELLKWMLSSGDWDLVEETGIQEGDES